jgi:hypothetical protein
MQAYRLLKDIENPHHDKRCTYGYKQYEVLKGGTFFEGRPAFVDSNNRFTAAYATCKAWSSIEGDTAALIIGNSVLTEPATWGELATLGGGYHHWANEVLEQLLKDKTVTLEQLKAALNDCLLSD